MRHPAVLALSALLTVLPGGALQARIAAPPPLPQRLVQADVVVLGTVTRIEEKPQVLPDGEEQRIAVVQIEEAIRGTGGVTHLRMAFPEATGRSRGLAPPIKPGLRGCFFLAQVPGKTYLTLPAWYSVVPRTESEFEEQIRLLKRCVRLLEAAPASLEQAALGDRYLIAALRILDHRTPRAGQTTEEPIDARESKLLLGTLAEVSWEKPDPTLPGLAPQMLFFRLGITAEDGFERPRDFKDFPEAARKWLRAHADTYRIKRFVEAKAQGK